MKHFSIILGLLTISAGLQDANAMNLHKVKDQSNEHQYTTTTTVEIEQTVSKRDIFKRRLEQETMLLAAICLDDIGGFEMRTHKYVDTNQIPTTITFIDNRSNDDAFMTGLDAIAMARNESVDDIRFDQLIIDSFDYVGLGLQNLEAYNARVIGKGVFANNRKLSNVTISAHNDGLIIDKYAFANCGTINSFSIHGEVERIDNNAFMNTVVNRLTIDGQRNTAIDNALRRNNNIKQIDWLQDMSEDEDY